MLEVYPRRSPVLLAARHKFGKGDEKKETEIALFGAGGKKPMGNGGMTTNGYVYWNV